MKILLGPGVALVVAACGNVAKTPDANTADAPFPDALVCTAPQAACGGACFDLGTSHDHCGTCDIACTSAEDCVAGHCTDATASCTAIRQFMPGAASGVYTHKLDGTKFYCDMTTMLQYDALAMAAFNATPAGYTQISAADLATPAGAAAFVAVYNMQTGLIVPTAFTSTNCCFKNDANAMNNVMLFLQGLDLYPGSNNVKLCSPAGGYVVGTIYQLVVAPDTANPIFANAPIGNDFFTTFPPSAPTGCSTGTNPALYWKRHP